ncbi:MAG: deoxyguanosinetriphosphate triphosphohydrolase [Alphaproteobacteria bacterium]|nr:deoxyguanosinetriphosphate triphosphohydrolase [Alphaproteobacteria bacterium]
MSRSDLVARGAASTASQPGPLSPPRAAYATLWEQSRGRLHPEADSPSRTPFQRDRDRLIHCTAFRRLMHKTQVFVSPTQDHVRTRLTHSLEVAQIARSMARTLGLDEDLTEFLALGHDIGHPPFGHTGEEALDAVMAPYGGYDHNDQALRVVTKLEHRYPDFEGLNLTWESLEGLVKHNGPLIGDRPKAFPDESALPRTIRAYNRRHDLDLTRFAGMEAQVAAISDDIAYNHHDLDDGLRARLFSISEASEAAPHVGAAFRRAADAHPQLDVGGRLAHRREILISEAVRSLIGDMVGDVLAETKRRLAALRPQTVDDIRGADAPVVAFSKDMAVKEHALKAFLFRRMYRNDLVNGKRRRGRQVVRALFKHYMMRPDELPPPRAATASASDEADRAVLVSDYIAGMTDRFAMREAELHTGLKSGLV